MGSGAYETPHTPDLLKELGYKYLMDWPMDDQPVWMRTAAGRILSIPYPVETDGAIRLARPLLLGGLIGLVVAAARWRQRLGRPGARRRSPWAPRRPAGTRPSR